LDIKFPARIKLLVIAFSLAIVCIPIAMIITIFSNPLWLWFEKTFPVEATGHSGPAEWCYIAVYLLLISITGFIWFRISKRKRVIK
jgi:hypothetical protein